MFTWCPGQTLASIEQDVIMQAVRHFEGNLTSASRALGIGDRTMRNKVESYKAQAEVKRLRAVATKRRNELSLKLQRGQITEEEFNAGLLEEPENDESHENDLDIPTPEAKRAHG